MASCLFGAKPLPTAIMMQFYNSCLSALSELTASGTNFTNEIFLFKSWFYWSCQIADMHRSLQWHHYECNVVSNHQRLGCLFNRLFRRRSKKTSKLRITGLCEGNSPVTGVFPTQRASNVENVCRIKTGSGGVCCHNARGRVRNRKSNPDGVAGGIWRTVRTSPSALWQQTSTDRS